MCFNEEPITGCPTTAHPQTFRAKPVRAHPVQALSGLTCVLAPVAAAASGAGPAHSGPPLQHKTPNVEQLQLPAMHLVKQQGPLMQPT